MSCLIYNGLLTYLGLLLISKKTQNKIMELINPLAEAYAQKYQFSGHDALTGRGGQSHRIYASACSYDEQQAPGKIFRNI